MEFRAPTVATELNSRAINYLTETLDDPAKGRKAVDRLIVELGGAVDGYPDWHPLLTTPPQGSAEHITSLFQLDTYRGIDHTVEFVRGFVTCPYSEEKAQLLVEAVNAVPQLHAYQLEEKLYSDSAFPVVVVADEVVLEGDGTIRSRDALIWFTESMMQLAHGAEVAETWWNIRSCILGTPHGSRSSLFVNQNAGAHMRKILEALNNSGMFGPIKEESLAMLSEKKQDTICENLIATAVKNWDKKSETFEFELRGETCKAEMRDTWNDGTEISIRVEIAKDLRVSGFYYEKRDEITHGEPRGKRAVAEKFL